MKKTLAGVVLTVQIVSAQNIAQKLDKVTKDLWILQARFL
jgi:D-alanyl-D-alanine carboxypeptidase/D-alanyl-D-alanine-endopeptidase (penicillin-binding protein 4)